MDFSKELIMKTVFRVIRIWLPLAIATAGLCGLAYLVVQQSLRMGANDPQIQMAEDSAAALNSGSSIDLIIPTAKVEIANSLALFLIVFDELGKSPGFFSHFTRRSPDLSSGCTGLHTPTWRRPRHLAAGEWRPYGDGGCAIR